MKALLLALFISSHALAAIPHGGDDERSIRNPIALKKQARAIQEITREMNIVLINSVKLRQEDFQLGSEINELAKEIQYLNEASHQFDEDYLRTLRDDIELYQEEIHFLTK